MKKLLYITTLIAAITIAACGDSTKPFTEQETKSQDSIDKLNQEDAFDALLNDTAETDSL